MGVAYVGFGAFEVGRTEPPALRMWSVTNFLSFLLHESPIAPTRRTYSELSQRRGDVVRRTLWIGRLDGSCTKPGLAPNCSLGKDPRKKYQLSRLQMPYRPY